MNDSVQQGGEAQDDAGRFGTDANVGSPSDGVRTARAEMNARLWRDLLDLDRRLNNDSNIRLLTPEARVLLHLKMNGPISVTAAMQVSGISYRGFYAVLERLKQAGLIATVKDEIDQRVRKLSIDPSAPAIP